MRHVPGFVSASFHVNRERTCIVSYAQWKSHEAFQAMLARSDTQPLMARARELSASLEPIVCTVVSSDTAA